MHSSPIRIALEFDVAFSPVIIIGEIWLTNYFENMSFILKIN